MQKIKAITGKHELILSLIVLLLIASFMEFLYGSTILGLVFLFILILIMLKISERTEERTRRPSLMALGSLIIVSVIAYNYLTQSSWGNLDAMVILFGSSLILMNTKNSEISTIARFSAWMSLIFISSFFILYSLPHAFGIPLPYYYGHYLITLPIVSILKFLGLKVDTPSMRIIRVNGVEPIDLKIELSCFGWYSLLLALSTVISYNLTIKRIERRRLTFILLTVTVAVYLTNLMRIAILVTVAYFYGIKTMMIFHSHIGWILFAAVLMPIIYILIK